MKRWRCSIVSNGLVQGPYMVTISEDRQTRTICLTRQEPKPIDYTVLYVFIHIMAVFLFFYDCRSLIETACVFCILRQCLIANYYEYLQ